MKLRTLAAAGFLVLSLGACDLLSTEPRQSVSPEVGLGSIEAIQAILTSGYNRLQGADTYGQRQIIAPEILSDNAYISPSPSGRYTTESVNAIGTGVGGWTAWYNVISDANYVLHGLEQVEAAENVEARARGEALFLRALAYHNLVRIYGYEPTKIVNGWDRGVIIRTEPVLQLTEADLRSRSTVQEVYALIESDLLESITLLTGNSGTSRYRATQASAEALLARVYLYWERWQDAATRATNAMNATSARLATAAQLPTMFVTRPNPESIFEVAIGLTETLGVNNAISSITTPIQAGWFDVLPSPELLALYGEGDVRRTAWYANSTRANTAGLPYSTKFTGSLTNYTDHVPVIRYSEMLLIRAEAYAALGQAGNALADLATLRSARGAAALDAGVNLMQTIMDERRRELAFEGHRWFDLKRKGMAITKSANVAAQAVPYDDFRILAPIPTSQTDLNENLEQNPGYAND